MGGADTQAPPALYGCSLLPSLRFLPPLLMCVPVRACVLFQGCYLSPLSLPPSALLRPLCPVMSSPASSPVAAEQAEQPAAVAPAVDPAGDFFGAPRFASLEWRVDVQRHSNVQADALLPSAIVQINTRSSDSSAPAGGEQQLQFEMDRATAAHVLLQLEQIDAIMAAAAH